MKNFKLLRIVVSQIAFQARKVSEMGTSSLQCGRYTRLLIACASYFRFPTEASIITHPHTIVRGADCAIVLALRAYVVTVFTNVAGKSATTLINKVMA